MSINEALAEHSAAGWTLASNVMMAELFDDFGFASETDEEKFAYDTENYLGGTDELNEDKFITLFGRSHHRAGGGGMA